MFLGKWSLSLRILPLVGSIMILKIFFHQFGWEFISVNPLFSGLIAANVFLLGFLISGVLVDYKESEKYPGDLASHMESIVDEVSIIHKNKGAKTAKDCLEYLLGLTVSLKDWFYKKESTKNMMDKISGLNDFFLAFEPLTQANFIVRLKGEQSTIRRVLTRIHTIRETSFVSSGYAIAEATVLLLTLGLLLSNIEPFYESLFFIGIITFLLIYMLALIKDLDNPFDYYEKRGSSDEVSLKPLDDLEKRIREKIRLTTS